MKALNLLACLFLLTAIGSNSYAKGKEGGGGDAFVADYVSIGYKVYGWLEKNGQLLSPKVSALDFISNLEPKKILSQDEPLYYRGTEVDAYFDGGDGFTRINRSRYRLITQESLKWRLVSHETFRRMGLEDDQYEITQQIIASVFSMPDLSKVRPGIYSLGAPMYWDLHVEVDPSHQRIYVQLVPRSHPNTGKGFVYVYECKSNTPPQCESVNQDNADLIRWPNKLTLLSDGNLVVNLINEDNASWTTFKYDFVRP